MATKPTASSTEPKPKKTRTPDPAKAELRERFKIESAAIDKAKKSTATLKTITEKMLPKLTEDDVRRMRQLRAEGWPYKRLSAEFGMTTSNVQKVCVRTYWKHVA